MHCLDGPDRIETMPARRLEIEYFAKLVEKRLSRTLPDTDCAITLHVAVPAHRTKSGPRLSDLAPQEHEVDDLLDVCDRIAVLRQAHGPTKDRAFGCDKDLCCLFDSFL